MEAGNIRVEVESEEGCSSRSARVLVYQDERLVAEVIAIVEPKQGMDGELYPCVTLVKREAS